MTGMDNLVRGKTETRMECRGNGVSGYGGSLTVIAEEKESGDEVQCHSPFELARRT